jgi:hypothetical protein
MTISAISKAEASRQVIASVTAPGLPRLPHIPVSWPEGSESVDMLTPEQQEANLLHVALWILERDQANLLMHHWHSGWISILMTADLSPEARFHCCGTAHCIAGFAQVMCGLGAFRCEAPRVGFIVLGKEAASHFYDSSEQAIAFLKQVVARNS